MTQGRCKGASPDGFSSVPARTVRGEFGSPGIGLVGLDVETLLEHDIQRNARLLDPG